MYNDEPDGNNSAVIVYTHNFIIIFKEVTQSVSGDCVSWGDVKDYVAVGDDRCLVTKIRAATYSKL